MADNPSIAYKTTPDAGETLLQPATDDIGGVHHQLVKVEFGASDSATMVSAAAPLPVDVLAGSDVKFAKIDHSASGNNQIVALVASKKIRVLAYTVIADGAVDVFFRTSSAGAALTGTMKFTTGGGVSPDSAHGLFETVAGEALGLNLSAAVGARGHLTYREV